MDRYQDQEETPAVPIPFGQKALIFGGSALALDTLLAIIQAPLPAEIAGLIAAAALAYNSPKIAAALKERFPALDAVLPEKKERELGHYTFTDRLLGKHRQGEAVAGVQPVVKYPAIAGRQAVERRHAAASRDRLVLGEIASSKRRFDPTINSILGKGVLLAGSQGTGKSNIIGLIVQAAGTCGTSGMPVVVIDFKGEFHTLREVVFNGVIACDPEHAKEMGAGYYPLSKSTAPELADFIMEAALQVVVDIPSYNGDGDLVADVVSELLNSLVKWGQRQRRDGVEPWPCLIITDEAHNFLPERQNLSALAMKKGRESFGKLTSAYSSVGNTGRSYGYTIIHATQRLPNIAKWSIANLQKKVILAHAEKNDLDACELETNGQVSRSQIKALAQGTGIVIGYGAEPMVVSFDKQKARHVSTTPQVERLHAQFKGRAPKSLEQLLADRQASRDDEPEEDEDDDGMDCRYMPVVKPSQNDRYQQLHQQRKAQRQLTLSNSAIRPTQSRTEQQKSGRNARNVTASQTPSVERERGEVRPVTYARNVEDTPASREAVSGQMNAVTGVTDWDQQKVGLLIGFYHFFGNLDDSLKALQLSTSQKNREMARAILKQQGQWKEGK